MLSCDSELTYWEKHKQEHFNRIYAIALKQVPIFKKRNKLDAEIADLRRKGVYIP